MIEEKVIKEFIQFIKHHSVVLSEYSPGRWTYCSGILCENCSNGPKYHDCSSDDFDNETMQYIREKYPEHFI